MRKNYSLNFLIVFIFNTIVTYSLLGSNTSNSSTKISNKLTTDSGIEFVKLPGGFFNMGTPNDEVNHLSDETQHGVILSSFKMSKYEITNSQFANFLNANNVGSDGKFASGLYPDKTLIYASYSSWNWGLNFSNGVWTPVAGYENYPVVHVTWYGATEFARYNGGSLPTEAQWEYACRAGSTAPFNSGSCLTNLDANYRWPYPYNDCTNSSNIFLNKTLQVGSYPPNNFGLYDMHGNVSEWCKDLYADYPDTTIIDPINNTNGTQNIVRGGSWLDYATNCRSGKRYSFTPGTHWDSMGFRIVLNTTNNSTESGYNCFSSFLTNTPNLIQDPEFNNKAYYSNSWGNFTTISNVGSDCNANTGFINGTAYCYPNGGSFTTPTIIWEKNSNYIIRALVQTMNGTFNMGLGNVISSNGILNDYDFVVPFTKGKWQQFEQIFQTDNTATSGLVWFNNCGIATGSVAYIDNWELYKLTDPIITSNKKSIEFNTSEYIDSIVISTANITGDVNINVPLGISCNINKITLYNTKPINQKIIITFDGSRLIDDTIRVSNSIYTLKIPIIAYPNSNCFVPFTTARPNLIPDPEMNSSYFYSYSWGNYEISTEGESYCGNRSGKINGTEICWPNGGSFTTSPITWERNKKYVIRAIVKTMNGTFNMGLGNVISTNGVLSSLDFVVPNTNGNWEQFEKVFQTDNTATNGLVYFNTCGLATGTVAYIDNWELYNIDGLVLTSNSNSSSKDIDISIVNNNIVLNYLIDHETNIEVTMYNIQGMQLENFNLKAVPGKNTAKFSMKNISSGMYVIRANIEGKSTIIKAIK